MKHQVWFIAAILVICEGGVTSKQQPLPSFAWHETLKSSGGIPLLTIHFHDGKSDDVALLERYNPIPLTKGESLDQVDQCIFKGHLQDERNVHVIMTGGCPFSNTFEISFKSSRLADNMFAVVDGNVVAQQSSWRNGLGRMAASDAVPVPGRNYEDQAVVSERKPYPPFGMKMKAKLISDSSFTRKFGSDSINAMRRVISHAQYYFYLGSSLGTTITIDVVGHQSIPENVTADQIGSMTKYATDDSINAYIFICHDTELKGALGRGYLAAMCGITPYRVSVSGWLQSDSYTGQVVAHELGHNLGMSHDFTNENPSSPRFDRNGNLCTGVGGIMDYQANPNRWSTCSAQDFQDYYNSMPTFCLQSETQKITTTTTAKPCQNEGGLCFVADKDPSNCQKDYFKSYCKKSCKLC